MAGSLKGFKQLPETKLKKKSLSLKYTGVLNPNYGNTHSKESKHLMSKKKSDKNPLFGKSHTDNTKNLIRIAALGRIHSD